MASLRPAALLAVAVLAYRPSTACAGMPVVTLSDAARLRLENISFFLVGVLLSAGIVQLLWNFLRRDFAILPRLGYGKALGLVTLWGLLFVLVLTMISGARELLTPGAWTKQGFTYRLDAPPAPPPTDPDLEWARKQKLDQLRVALWTYAGSHGSQFPPSTTVPEIPADAWKLPDASGIQYVYVPGLAADRGVTPLAYEPDVFGPQRYVLFTNGEIRRMELGQFAQALPSQQP